jgi:hypothetical protein
MCPTKSKGDNRRTHPMISEKTKKNLEARYNCHISINDGGARMTVK